jgi:hypothetical protein
MMFPRVSLQTRDPNTSKLCGSRTGGFDINTMCEQNVKASGTYSYHCVEVSALLAVCRHLLDAAQGCLSVPRAETLLPEMRSGDVRA